MMMSRPNAMEEKKDLHFGGLGAQASPALAAVTDPVQGVAESWLRGIRDAAETTEDFVRDNPWAALAVAGVIGLSVGFLLARQD